MRSLLKKYSQFGGGQYSLLILLVLVLGLSVRTVTAYSLEQINLEISSTQTVSDIFYKGQKSIEINLKCVKGDFNSIPLYSNYPSFILEDSENDDEKYTAENNIDDDFSTIFKSKLNLVNRACKLPLKQFVYIEFTLVSCPLYILFHSWKSHIFSV